MKKAKLLSLFQRDPKKVKKAKLPENVYYSPANDMSPLWQYVGLALRTLVLYLGVFGITVFICSAAGLTYSDYWQAKVVTPGTVALLCLPVAIACGIASLGKIWALATPIVYVGAFIGYAAINYTDPIAFTVRSVLRVYNYALYNVSGVYTNLQSFMYVTDGYDYQSAEYDLNDPYRFAGVFILASIIGLILYFSVQRKTRLWPVVILLTAVFTPILTYNIAYGNSGISFILVFVCALLGLKVYDYRYGGRAESVAERKKRKAEKKSLRIEKRKKKRKEKLALREEADRVFDKAIDADIPLGKARQARRAVFRSHRDNIKKEKLEKKALARTEKKNAKRARKLKKKRVAELKKKLSASPKGSTSHQAVLAEIAAERADDLEAKANRKAKIQKKRLEKKDLDTARRKASMAGGYAGIGVALIAFLAICLPLSLAKGPFREIPVINDRVRTARAYVTAYLRGSDVDLNDPYVYGLNPLVPRALSYDPLELTDDVIFRV
ncbi:MAG: hypothetical protein IJD22_00355, partial [Clostridia bacterium]|nr:hypothetical protein [Clostridia bacterium]